MNTKEKLKTILLEWHNIELPTLFKRDFDSSLLSSGNEILSIIGSRRAGKTFLCYQIIEDLRKTNPKDHIIYINFEDERLAPLRGDELTLLWDIYLELFSPNPKKNIFLFLDEVQNIKNWSKWARRITEQHRNLKLILTGSSSKLLSKDIATELRGRTISHTVFPLSFKEFLHAKNLSYEPKNLLYSKDRVLIKRQFNNYFKRGGFPAVLENKKPQDLLREYYGVMFYRDLLERYKIQNIKLFEDFLTLMIDQTACDYSISSTAKKLQDFGYSFSKNTLTNFSRYAQEIFLLFETRLYEYKVKTQLRAPKKIYSIDHGLMQAIRFSFSDDFGKILENIVFLELKRRGKEVYYFKDNISCDFIIADRKKILKAIQVTKNLSNEKTRKREIEGLLAAINKYTLKEGLILTDDEHDTIKINNKIINVLPVWYWSLLKE